MNFFKLLDMFDNTHGTKVQEKIKLDDEQISSEVVNDEIKLNETQNIESIEDVKSAEDLNADILKNLRTIEGYVGSVITDYDGVVLMSDTAHMEDDFSLSVSIFNDIFRSAHKTSKELNLGVTETMSIIMDEGMIIMACSGEERESHIHIFVLLNKDVNTILAKREIDRTIKKHNSLTS